tara:strand:+ start:4270 stop:5898 length:1629 start_codon:yes stop_codon:yes gene_type:complete
MSLGERIDNAIYSIFPAWGSRRKESRDRYRRRAKASELALERAERVVRRENRAYEGADSTDRLRGSKWLASRLAPNSQLTEDWEDLVVNCEDMFRKDAFAASAVNGRVSNVVGRGIRPQARVRAIDGVLDESEARALNERIDAVMRIWADEQRLYDKQRLYEQSKAIYGEGIAVLSAREDGIVPLHLQIMHPRRLETPPNQTEKKNLRLGIRFDKWGEPTDYFIRTSHPEDDIDTSFQWMEVEAERVCHSYSELLPGQSRGVPWLAPVLTLLKDLKDFSEAHLIGEQVAACFSAFIRTDGDPLAIADGARASGSTTDRLEELSPGLIQYLGEGQDVTFGGADRPGNTLGPYMEWHLRAVAAGLGYPFEMLVKDYSRTNYSSGRLSLIDGRQFFGRWQQEAIDDCWSRVYKQFLDDCVATGVIDIDPVDYEENRAEFQRHAWIAPGWPWVDPVKEVDADIKAVEGNMSTETDVLAARGHDYDEVRERRTEERLQKIEARAKEIERAKELAEEMGVDIQLIIGDVNDKAARQSVENQAEEEAVA